MCPIITTVPLQDKNRRNEVAGIKAGTAREPTPVLLLLLLPPRESTPRSPESILRTTGVTVETAKHTRAPDPIFPYLGQRACSSTRPSVFGHRSCLHPGRKAFPSTRAAVLGHWVLPSPRATGVFVDQAGCSWLLDSSYNPGRSRRQDRVFLITGSATPALLHTPR